MPLSLARGQSPWSVLREELAFLRGQLEGAKALLDTRSRRIAKLERELAHTDRELQALNIELMLAQSLGR